MGIQSSINTALGVAAITSGLTNKKQVDKAQDKLDKKESQLANTKKDLTNTKKDLAETKAEKDEVIKQQAEEKYKQNIQRGGNTFNVSNDLPTAKETNVDNAGDKSVNDIKVPSLSEFIKDAENEQKKLNPYTVEQVMGFHALKLSDSMVAAKRELRERSRSRRTMISDRARAARENGGNK